MADADQSYVDEPGKRVPVAYEADVVVAGAGIAGTIAAIAAGRHGAKTIIVDRFGQIGGNMGPGMFAGGSLHFALKNQSDADDTELLNRTGMGSIADEFHRRVIFGRPNADRITPEVRRQLEQTHHNVSGYTMGSGGGSPGYLVDSQISSAVALEMMDEAGVETLMSVYVSDPIMVGHRVCGLFVETISGRWALRSKIVIDATGQADVAMRAGAPVLQQMVPNMGLWYSLGGVDWDRYEQFCSENEQANEDDLAWARRTLPGARSEADPAAGDNHLLPLIRKAWEANEFKYKRQVGTGIIHIAIRRITDGMAGGRTGTAGEIDVADAKIYSQMEREHRGHIYQWARFLRKYVPGFEDSYILVVAPFLGSRGGRYMDGVHTASREDMETERQFDDVLYEYNDRRSQKNCDVPYRTLVPQRIDGLLACGRSSVPYGPNFRMRSNMLMNGQAAGIAASLCVNENVEPRDLDVRKLQKILVDLDCPVAEDERLVGLGLK
ncbi:MAG: hypothetical protein CMJ20_14130 [Phycisphaeraceae bacterium]|nr:hypothetical protein [Phycisphaeraceae bacterium]|tara:strand:- start:374 stop:1858 length:1485 start_codon:yes stop_codon:yes gene_type:complete